MALPPPITALPIHTRADGFYAGFNHFVAVGSKVLIGLLIIWAAIFPKQAGGLSAINTAMIIGALPFSLVMALMGVSLVKAVVRDTIRQRETGGGQ